jgi:hypothetical protein
MSEDTGHLSPLSRAPRSRKLPSSRSGTSSTSEDPAVRFAEVLHETVGEQGRTLAVACRRDQGHVVVSDGGLLLTDGWLWSGDIDLTADEAMLHELARRIGQTIYLVERGDELVDARQSPIDQAVFSVTPDGHTRHQHEAWARSTDGRLRLRLSVPPQSPGRWNWAVVRHRPSLWRFWRIDRVSRDVARYTSCERADLVYVGWRDKAWGPVLVLGLTRSHRPLRMVGLEWTWYPSRSWGRPAAARPLIILRPHVRIRGLEAWLRITVWPGREYRCVAGYRLNKRSVSP